MPQIPYSEKNKSLSVFDMDQLKLRKGEKARIALMDENAVYQWSHWVNNPSAQDGGSKGGYYVCLGDNKKLLEDGAAPEVCPLCRVAEPSRDGMVSFPKRRFATHVARYRTNNLGQIMLPMALYLQVWLFGDDKYNALTDRSTEHGDLRKRDIVLTCTIEPYQKFDMDVSPKLNLVSDLSAKAQYLEIKKQHSKELERLLGRSITKENMEKMVSQAMPSIISDTDISANVDDVLAELESDPVDVVSSSVLDDTPDAASVSDDISGDILVVEETKASVKTEISVDELLGD